VSAEVHPFREWVQLEQPRLGTRVTFASDEFFAAKERLIMPADPVFIEDKYDNNGKWMDGWESRRRRGPGHDFCIIRLGVPGAIHGFDIDTSFFTGNYPPHASIDACVSDEDVPEDGWQELLQRTALEGNSHHLLSASAEQVWTHLRLNIYPDGGVARLRVYGEVRPDPEKFEGPVDLVALENGGRAIDCSDEHYGSMRNLNVAGRGINMGDGWETARRRGAGNDWVMLALGVPGTITQAQIDTAHFKGNYPDRVTLEAGKFDSDAAAIFATDGWANLLEETRLEADQTHDFEDEIIDCGVVSHVRMSIFPDGGVSRIRLIGTAEPGS